MTSSLSITICAKHEAKSLLRTGGFDAVISINDPPKGSRNFWFEKRQRIKRQLERAFHPPLLLPPMLFLFFYDIEDSHSFDGPRALHITLIKDFVRDLPPRKENNDTVKMLIHCMAGISRSTAAGIIALVESGTASDVESARKEIVRIRSIADPNTEMLRLYNESKDVEENESKEEN